MSGLHQKIKALLLQQESFVLATLIDRTGSMPRQAGTRMIVRADGSIFGTIGGGRLEAETLTVARELQHSRQTVILPFDLGGKDASAMDMICGGKGEVLIDFVDAADAANREVYMVAAAIMERREKAWFITGLQQEPGQTGIKRQICLVKPDKTLIGNLDCDPYLLEKLITGPAKISIHAEVFDHQRFLVEPLRQKSSVYIFGAGHVSQCIAPLSQNVGFQTTVLDDRLEFANRERFRPPVEIRLIASFRDLSEVAFEADSYMVIVTRGHLYDKIVLEQILRRNTAYVGMIGSRSKRDLVFGELKERGFTQAELERVHAPIGLNIGAETPEELAVSIVGELIQVRAGTEQRFRAKSEKPAGCCRIFTPDEG